MNNDSKIVKLMKWKICKILIKFSFCPNFSIGLYLVLGKNRHRALLWIITITKANFRAAKWFSKVDRSLLLWPKLNKIWCEKSRLETLSISSAKVKILNLFLWNFRPDKKSEKIPENYVKALVRSKTLCRKYSRIWLSFVRLVSNSSVNQRDFGHSRPPYWQRIEDRIWPI